MNLKSYRIISPGHTRVKIIAPGKKRSKLFEEYGMEDNSAYFITDSLIRTLQKHTCEFLPSLGNDFTTHCSHYFLQIQIPLILVSNLPPHIGLACPQLSVMSLKIGFWQTLKARLKKIGGPISLMPLVTWWGTTLLVTLSALVLY